MQKVISINLNGNTYQLDESGYDALREYLAVADRALEGNPDRAEIMIDLEQAIADKCQKYLGQHKTVVSAAEVAQIIVEMGPIESGTDGGAGSEQAAGSTTGKSDHAQAPPRRLYRFPDGAMIAGVCAGLASFLGVDVTIVRVAFVLIAVLTKGVGIFLYVAMMFVIPEPQTAEERAAAGGLPFNAKDVIERAKKQYAEGTRHMRRQLRQQQRHWRRYSRPPGMAFAYAHPPFAAALLPLFSLIHLGLFVAMAAMLISLVNTGAVMDWRLPPNLPVWAGALILIVGYQIVVSPLRAVQHWSWQWRTDGPPAYAFWNAVVWLVGMAVVFWIASSHIPEIREFLQRVPPLVQQFAEAVRNVISPQR